MPDLGFQKLRAPPMVSYLQQGYTYFIKITPASPPQ